MAASGATFNDLVARLSPDTNYADLRDELEQRLLKSTSDCDLVSDGERQFLAGLRLRDEFLQIPSYAKKAEKDPLFWLSLILSRGRRRA